MGEDKKDSMRIHAGAANCHCGRRAVAFKMVTASAGFCGWRFLCGRETCEAEATKALSTLVPTDLEHP